jgi:energy-coupling factor transporter ATP-binding protein EcfA2
MFRRAAEASVTVISATDLSKRYGDVLALHRVNLTVEAGETFGFLGSNSAGKSTFTDILPGFVAPRDGTLSVFGHDCQDDSVAVTTASGVTTGGQDSPAAQTCKLPTISETRIHPHRVAVSFGRARRDTLGVGRRLPYSHGVGTWLRQFKTGGPLHSPTGGNHAEVVTARHGI